MRTHRTWIVAATLLAALVALPPAAQAKGFGRGGGRSSGSSSGSHSSSSSSGSSSGGGFGRSGGAPSGGSSSGGSSYGAGRTSGGYRVNTYPAGNGGYRAGPGYEHHGYENHGYENHGYGYGYPRYGYGYSVGIYSDPYYAPYYAGWGVYPYGYYARGYYPYWGAPPATQENPEPREYTFSLLGGALGSSMGLAPYASLGIDGHRWGFNLQGMILGNPNPAFPGVTDAMPMFSTHLAYSVISNPHARVRVEGGIAGIAGPDFSYYGPDLGASGLLAIAGPLGLQGSFHVTPFPATIIDTTAGLALNFGGLGLQAGWRMLHLDDRRVNNQGDTLNFSGPAVSVGLMY